MNLGKSVKRGLVALVACMPLWTWGIPDAADWHPKSRWRGFNLLEMFNREWSVTPGEFRESDFRLIRDWGFNFVRLPMDYRYWIVDGDWERMDESVVRHIDRAIAFGRTYGVHVQVCMHRCPGYTVAHPKERRSLFVDPEALRVCAKHWRFFAKRWKGIPNDTLSFNLFNEPDGSPQYAAVAKTLIAAIREADPSRFVMADGANFGGQPVPELYGLPSVGQATRGYKPLSVTHYRVDWASENTSASLVWPPPVGILAGRGNADMSRPIEVLDVPPCRVSCRYGRVSGKVSVQFSADGRVVATETLEPRKSDPNWKRVEFDARWQLSRGEYVGRTVFQLPEGAHNLKAEVVSGDWLDVCGIELSDADGNRAELPFVVDWVRPFAFRQRFAGFKALCPFEAQLDAVFGSSAGDLGQAFLRHCVLAAWEGALKRGRIVMAGEFGTYKNTPHAVALDILEDYLKLWKERNIGWALWNFRGDYGILDSGRKDVKYEDFKGMKLDRKMLELLQRY